MLREDSVTYSSLPQDEGTTPRNSFVTTRPSPGIHNRRDCQLTAIITSVVIVTGVTLAATLPFLLKGKPEDLKANDKSAIDDIDDSDFWSSHLNIGGENSMTIEEPHGSQDLVVSSGTKTPIPVVAFATTKPPSALVKITTAEVKNATGIPVAVSVLSISEGDNTDADKESVESLSEGVWSAEEKVTIKEGNDMMVTEGPYDLGENTNSEVEGDKEYEMGGSTNAEVGEKVNKTVTGSLENAKFDGNDKEGSLTTAKSESIKLPSTRVPHTDVDDIDLNKLLNEIYGEQGQAKPFSVEDDSMTNNVMSSGDKMTLVVLAAVVAVALAAVIAAVGWLVHSRIVAKRRRLNIQSVITDLQSRDKIVLLNSEESEEE